MIVQQQISTARPESTQAYLGLLETEGVALLARFPGRLTGLFACHIGPLSRVIEMWAYDTMADLDARRRAPGAGPAL